LKHFYKEFYELEVAISDDYNEHLKSIVPDELLPIQRLCIIAREVDNLSAVVLSDGSEVNRFQARIRLSIARRVLNYLLTEVK